MAVAAGGQVTAAADGRAIATAAHRTGYTGDADSVAAAAAAASAAADAGLWGGARDMTRAPIRVVAPFPASQVGFVVLCRARSGSGGERG